MDENISIPGELLKAKDVAEILKESKTEVYRLLATELDCVRFGGNTVRIPRDALDKYISEHTIIHASHSHGIEK
jgi:excisionase family DNA binding protein